MTDSRQVQHRALVTLGRSLRDMGYRFTTITPASHRCVNSRPQTRQAASAADIFGWSRPFDPMTVPETFFRLLNEAGEAEPAGALVRSRVRFSSVGEMLFVHSAFPTIEPDSVFFGPDTYRFIRVLRASLPPRSRPSRIVDIGCGSGAGGLFVAASLGREAYEEVVLADVNPRALSYSRVNAELNDVSLAATVRSDVLSAVEGEADLIISNPPYLVDPESRAYRHGGGDFGLDISLRILRQSLGRLRPGGRLVLYTGVAILNGVDPLWDAVRTEFASREFSFCCEELDPDVFGEELAYPPYDCADRIAAVVLIADRLSESWT